MNRPLIGEYRDPVAFVRDMIRYRKKTEKGFSILSATRSLRKVSPALVSLVVSGKRSLTFDRADEFAKLLGLTHAEKVYLRSWVAQIESKSGVSVEEPLAEIRRNRKDVTTDILSDWINVYVKDFFQIPAFQKSPGLIEQQLVGIASRQRVQRAMRFLLQEGHLRRTMDGKIVVEANLAVAETKTPSRKVRAFHKATLGIAKQALDLYPTTERFAGSLIIPLDLKGYEELMGLIQEFGEKLQDFAASRTHESDGERLYQFLINVSPVGGKRE